MSDAPKVPMIAGKPVIFHDVKNIINMDSGFRHKELCDGPTFSAGTSCLFCCSFCFVESFMGKLPAAIQASKEFSKPFHELVLRRRNAVAKVREQLVDAKGQPKFLTPGDTRVIYASPLVDVAATVELAKETVEICLAILELTNWQIRLLSKSNLLPFIAERIPSKAKDRMIYGVSTGTIDDHLAKAFERGTALVSKRIKSLHELQDAGLRTFGMICPSLPQVDYDAFARETAAALRVDRCETCWAEVINVRGESMTRTCNDLDAAGYNLESRALRQVSEDKTEWERYSRATFLAHTKHISPTKLRFLQYINAKNRTWWTEHKNLGAVLLGRASESEPATAPTPEAIPAA